MQGNPTEIFMWAKFQVVIQKYELVPKVEV